MRSRFAVAVAAALLFAPPALFAQARQPRVTVIYGSLLGADGAPMKVANVQLLALRPSPVAQATATRTGHFAIATTEAGLFLVRFTGVDHASASIPLVLEPPTTVAVDVRLATFAYTDSLERVSAVGDWNAFAPATATPLVRQPDGRYTLEVPTTADTLAYQLLGLDASSGGRTLINGPQVGAYALDDRGHYRTIIRAQSGHGTIVLDPTQLDRRPSELSVTFRDPNSLAARQYALNLQWDRVRQEYFDTAKARAQRHDTTGFDWAPAVARLSAALGHERNPILRQILLLHMLDAAQFGATVQRPVAQRIVAEVRPGSFLWRDPIRTPWMIQQAFQIAQGDTADAADSGASRVTLAYLDSVIAEQPDTQVKGLALFSAFRLARRAKDPIQTNEYYTRLVTDFPDLAFTRLVKSQMAPGRAWRVGAEAPAFHFTALDDTGVIYTPTTFAGRVYLLDFWATWCAPCRAQMPFLQRAYDSLTARGLVILSVSLDQSPADVRRFRAGQWKMPWLNANVPGGSDIAQMQQLEINILPRVMLIGKDGRILAVDDERLRGDALLPTLRRALEQQTSP